MIHPRAKHAAAAAATLTLLAIPFAGSASAQGDTQRQRAGVEVDAVRARCDAAVDKRLTTLDDLTTRVQSAKRVSDAEKQPLLASIDATRSGLTTLRSEIDGDTQLTDLRTDCKRIVDDYRVYVLLAPQVRLTIAADASKQAVNALDQAIPKVETAIQNAANAGKDVTEPNELLDDVKAQRASASSLAEGVLAAVSPLTPADYNAGRAQPVLNTARADMKTALDDLRKARNDIRTIRDDLR
jgi:hypothetical protein